MVFILGKYTPSYSYPNTFESDGNGMNTLLGLLFLGLSGFSFWVMWWPILGFVLSLVPAGSEYAWAGNLLSVALVGYFGGIVIPLTLLVLSGACFVNAIQDY